MAFEQRFILLLHERDQGGGQHQLEDGAEASHPVQHWPNQAFCRNYCRAAEIGPALAKSGIT
jgi:hypothetical protein